MKTSNEFGSGVNIPPHNDGTEVVGNVRIPFGKDASEWAGKASDERLSMSNVKGSINDLSHTLSGSKSNQGEENKKGYNTEF